MVVRKIFLKELDELNSNIVKMGSLVEKIFSDALRSIEENNKELSNEVLKSDDKIDQLNAVIEKSCINLILKEQPLASDLRFISASLKIITDLERIGDNSVDIAEILEGHESTIVLPESFSRMGEEVRSMVKKSIDAFVRRDVVLAKKVCEQDDIVDKLYIDNIKMITDNIKNDIDSVENLIGFILLNRFLERIADHATNICEWLVYYETGEYKELN